MAPRGVASFDVISGAGLCVGPMMKLPSAFAGGTAPSSNSVAVTYPAECGSRVGGTGRGRATCCARTSVLAASRLLTSPAVNRAALILTSVLLRFLGCQFTLIVLRSRRLLRIITRPRCLAAQKRGIVLDCCEPSETGGSPNSRKTAKTGAIDY